ncbi:MAG TPA: SpoIIE family protein phosphatase [Thermoanaerobaculia bacterium]|nr:SpoIIE family protein phosphatase [Thermoanaerobaculia bacterium]
MRFRPLLRTATLVLAALEAVLAVLAAALWHLHLPYVNMALGLALAVLGLPLLLWLIFRALRAFLYKVGRRLAFSYFLIGGLPIPMLLLVLGVVAYLLASFFLGHLYRDALRSVHSELVEMARDRAEALARTGSPAGLPAREAPGIVFGYYRGGRRIGGDPHTPESWPRWAETELAPGSGAARGVPIPFFARGDGNPTLAAAVEERRVGVVALYVADLDHELSRRSDLWVEVNRPDDPAGGVEVGMGNRSLPVQLRRNRNVGEAQKFFKGLSRGEGFWDEPMIWWGQTSGPLLDLGSGRRLADHLLISLNGTPNTVARHLFSSSGEVDAAAWGTLLGLAVLLANVYLAAALMALFMIVGLSRAVNRMSRATDAVRRGDFGARIKVRRRDQVGELQRSFNEMAANLEMLVATSAQKELLDKELALAREVQNSLIPTDLPAGDGVEFATLFEPSAAIGGDYFDVLRLSDRQVAVIIADVSGHGLSTGMRMAMLKAALLVLIEATRDPDEVLRRLDAMVRGDRQSRFFVTATLGVLDLDSGRLKLTNAGHPPTYLVRGGAVEEIVLPSSPLGGLGTTYGHRDVALQHGDVVVWLSDGLIEAENAAGDPFGYERVYAALHGTDGRAATAAAVRDRLLTAVERYVAGQPPSDDRTLVALHWK